MPGGHRLATLARASALVTAFALAAATLASALESGVVAPPFRLGMLVGKTTVRSDSLFAARPHTLVIVWNTGCPECVADLVETSRRFGDSGPDAQLVGICTDVERVSDARRLVTGARLAFPNLWDADRTLERAWGTVGLSFSAFLVDSTGVVRFVQLDHPDDVPSLLEAVSERMRASGGGGP
jgi:hypothetical protein